MTRRLAFGELPFYTPRVVTGRYLEPASFKTRSGTVPVAYGHWRDNDRLLSSPAIWSAGSTSLMFAHTLEDTDEFERSILEDIARGLLYWSYGDGDYPGATRSAIATAGGKSIAYAVKPLEFVTFQHVSYVREPAFAQPPIRWVGLN